MLDRNWNTSEPASGHKWHSRNHLSTMGQECEETLWRPYDVTRDCSEQSNRTQPWTRNEWINEWEEASRCTHPIIHFGCRGTNGHVMKMCRLKGSHYDMNICKDGSFKMDFQPWTIEGWIWNRIGYWRWVEVCSSTWVKRSKFNEAHALQSIRHLS